MEDLALNEELKAIRQFVLDGIKAHCFEKKEFTLASGRKSDFYIDIRRISFDGSYLLDLGILLYEEIKKLQGVGSLIAGVPVGGLLLVSSVLCAGFIDGNPSKSVVIRKEKKPYGGENLIEPVRFLEKGINILIIEDVVTTGGSILKAVKSARDEGYEVTDALCVVDRDEGGFENLKGNGVNLHSLFSRTDIEEK